MNELLSLVLVNGMSDADLRAYIEAQMARWDRYHGLPIMPPGCEVTIVTLPGARIEPDIEDEP